MKFLGPAMVAAIGFGLGYLIWELSPLVTGRVEPWDSKGGYYYAALFLAGVVGSLPSPRWYPFATVGVFGGQACFLFTLPPGPFWPLGLIFAGGFSFISLAGGWALNRFLRLDGKPRRPGD